MERSIVLVTIRALTKPIITAFSSFFLDHIKGIFNVSK